MMLNRIMRLFAVCLTVLLLSGCASDGDRVDTSGPPPAGYETWDEYFDAQDALQREVETDMRMNQGRPVPLRGY